jgi:hypothetical protein
MNSSNVPKQLSNKNMLSERLLSDDEEDYKGEDEKDEVVKDEKHVGEFETKIIISPPRPSVPVPAVSVEINDPRAEIEVQLTELQFCLDQLAAMQRKKRPILICRALFAIILIFEIATLSKANSVYHDADDVLATYNATIVPDTFNTTCMNEYSGNSCNNLLNVTNICSDLFNEYCNIQTQAIPWVIATGIIFLTLVCGCGGICVLSVACMRDPSYLFDDFCDYVQWYNDEEFDPIVYVAEKHDIDLFRKSVDDVYKDFSKLEKTLKEKISPSRPQPPSSFVSRLLSFQTTNAWKGREKKTEIDAENKRVASIDLDDLKRPKPEKPTTVTYSQREVLRHSLLASHMEKQQKQEKRVRANAKKQEKKADERIAPIDLDFLRTTRSARR